MMYRNCNTNLGYKIFYTNVFNPWSLVWDIPIDQDIQKYLIKVYSINL